MEVPVALDTPVGVVLLYLGVFAPSLVALSLTAWAEGGDGVRMLLQRLIQVQVAARWYLFAAGYMVAVKLLTALLYRLATGVWPRFGSFPLFLIPFAILISTPVQAGEEIGWRGYALPRLARRIGLGSASVLLGVVWAGWHLPLFFVPESDTYHQSFLVYALQVTALSVAMAWLWERTRGSLLLIMLMHAAVNNSKDIVPAAVPGGTNTFGLGGSLQSWLGVAVLWVCAAYFLAQMRSSKEERPDT